MIIFQNKTVSLLKGIDKEIKIGFIAGMAMFFWTHLYFFTNHQWTNDDLQFSVCREVKHFFLGRWANCIPYTSEYLLPIPSFLFTIVLFGIACAFLVKILSIRSPFLIVLLCGTVVTFPSLSEMFGYGWLIEGFSLGILFSILASYFMFYETKSKRKQSAFVLVSSIFIALSMGEYQAYIACALAIALIKLLIDCFYSTKGQLFRDIIRSCIAFSIGGVLYLTLVDFSCWITGTELESYKGIDKMGEIDLCELPTQVAKAYDSFWGYIIGTRFYGSNLLIKSFYLVICFSIVIFSIYALYKNDRIKDWFRWACVIIILCLFPISMNPVDVLAPETNASCLQVYGFSFLFVLFVKLLDILGSFCEEKRIEKLSLTIGLLLILGVVYNNFLLTNIYYQRLSKYADYTINMANRMLMRLEEMDGCDVYSGNSQKLVVITGSPIPYNFNEPWPQFINEQGGKHKFNGFQGGVAGMPSVARQAANALTDGLGANFIPGTKDDINHVKNSDEFLSMKAWPDKESIKCIDGIYVVSMVDGLRIENNAGFLMIESQNKFDENNMWWRVYRDDEVIVEKTGESVYVNNLETGDYRVLLSVNHEDYEFFYEENFTINNP